jgi:hypothetical protein
MPSSRFSLSAVLLSYFLTGGGLVLGLLLVSRLGLHQRAALYLMLGVGGAIGGLLAARATAGTTVLEPAIGGLLLVVTMVSIFIGTGAGEFLWQVGKDEIVRQVAIAGAVLAAGSVVGAVAGERLLSGQSTTAVAWLVHVAVATLGACFVAMVLIVGLMLHGTQDTATIGGSFFGAVALGGVLTGLVVGATAPRRLLGATFLGVGAGVMGFFVLMLALPNRDPDKAGDAAAGFLIIGVGCGLLAMLGGAIGWRLIGKRAAAAASHARAFE